MPALAEHRHVFAVDLPGFGWSDPSAHGYSTNERSRTILELLDELGVNSVDIVGHDWGAWLAFRVALVAPERVGRLVSISEIHPWPLQRLLIPNLWRMWVTALFEIPGLGSIVQRRRPVVRWFLRRDAKSPATWTETLVSRYSDKAAEPAVAKAGQRLHFAFVMLDIPRLIFRRDRTRLFHVPTLLLAGSDDAYIPPTLVTPPSLRKTFLRVETIPGGHFLLDENPRGVTTAVLAHLLRHD